MPEDAAYCPGCGRPAKSTLRAEGKVGVFPENIAGALAYFTIVPAILFLVLEPYKRSRFIRFHSFQCLALWVASLIIGVVLKVAALVLLIIPILGPLLIWLLSTVIGLALFILWVVLIVKALQGEAFILPIIGDFAEQQAAAV